MTAQVAMMQYLCGFVDSVSTLGGWMTRMTRTILRALGALAVAFAANVHAQAPYPNHPVRIVVPFPAGGTTDILARATAQKLTETLGSRSWSRTGPAPAGNIGAEIVAKSPPDGYTMLMGTVGTHAINASLYEKMPYDHVKDFVPVVLVAGVPNVLVVHPSVPAKSVQELIAYAKANPGKLNFASSGSGTSIHLSGELFKTMTGVSMQHVPYKGSAPALADLTGDRCSSCSTTSRPRLPLIKAGKLRALAVTSLARASALPDVPTIAESGFRDSRRRRGSASRAGRHAEGRSHQGQRGSREVARDTRSEGKARRARRDRRQRPHAGRLHASHRERDHEVAEGRQRLRAKWSEAASARAKREGPAPGTDGGRHDALCVRLSVQGGRE
jgi:tripartite-type tricarboxylate transporter receptor subunit TctC